MDKSLQEQAIQFKGRDYVQVKDRVNYFVENYPNGCIQTVKLESTDRMEFKAIVIPDIQRPTLFFTGHSQASFADTTSFVNKTSAMENAETSAVGRALGFMGIGVIDSIASADEIHKANSVSVAQNMPVAKPVENKNDVPFSNKVVGEQCQDCGLGVYVKSPTKGTIYCGDKCWLKK